MSEVVDKNPPPPLGRKVFFVNPSFKVQSKIVAALRENEYEVYVIRRWRDVKNYMTKNPNSICLISVDGQMSVQAWMAMCKNFSKDKILSTTICGFLTENALKSSARLAYSGKLAAGYNSTAGDEEQILRVLKGILDVHGAKGRRQYVRCSCFRENAFVYLTVADAGGNPSMFQMKIVDISTATVAVEVPNIFKGKFRQNLWIQNAVIVLNGRQVDTALQVFLIKQTPKGNEIAILSYYSAMPRESKTCIRHFVFDTLQKEMERSINGMPEDRTDYNIEAAGYQLVIGGKESDGSDEAGEGEAAAADDANASVEDVLAATAGAGEGDVADAGAAGADAASGEAGESGADAASGGSGETGAAESAESAAGAAGEAKDA